MKIESLNENTVKIHVSHNELQEMNLCFDELKNNTFKASLFFDMICKNLSSDFVKKAYVEIFNLDNDGLVIYFSKIPILETVTKRHVNVTIETENPRQLCKFCNELEKISENITKSRLYFNGKTYRLIIKMTSEKSEDIKRLVNKLKIYGRVGEIVPSVTCEHTELWKQILPYNAVKILSEGC